MHLDAQSLPPLPGPDQLAVLHHLSAHTAAEFAALHSATNTSHSVIAFDPLITLEIDPIGTITLNAPFELSPSQNAHPLSVLDQLVNAVDFAAPHPLIGWLGFISYDIARTLEKIPEHSHNELQWPLLRFTLFRHYLLHDPSTNQWAATSIAASPALAQSLLLSVKNPPALPAAASAKILRSISAETFHQIVARTRDYIAAGDIYQANLAQHWQLATVDPPHDIYRRLCQNSPAPYASFSRFTSAGQPRHILSASPELFISLHDEHLLTRPIKGTRRRDLADAAHDERLKEELLASAKDKAELAMIVDLLRNDLGRVSKFGSVRVEEPRAIEQHPTVWHTVATISSQLRESATLADLLAAACPGGSITGAPKIRAMQIIEELEGATSGRRDLYCGNIGVIGPRGKSLTLNIAIRTILMQGATAHVYAGGGIVADSDPQLEYEETLHKAAAPLRALGVTF